MARSRVGRSPPAVTGFPFISGAGCGATVRPMRAGIRDLTSLLIFGVALAAAFLCWRSPRPDYGMDLQVADGRMIVQTVDYGSMAWEAGLQPGMIITAIGGDRGSAGDLLADPDPSTMRA